MVGLASGWDVEWVCEVELGKGLGSGKAWRIGVLGRTGRGPR